MNDTPLCFLRGTLIATPTGERVEELKVGELILTAMGDIRPVIWVGHGRVLATRGRRSAATPIRRTYEAVCDQLAAESTGVDLHLVEVVERLMRKQQSH